MTNKPSTQPNRRNLLSRVDPERHARICSICRHEDRLEIEDAFLHWISPDYIVMKFDVSDRMALYRHVHATGLYEYRRRNLSSALDRLIEHVNSASVSGDCILRAIRAHSRLNEDGRWREPVHRVIVARRQENFVLPECTPEDLVEREVLLDTPKRVEIPVTHRK